MKQKTKINWLIIAVLIMGLYFPGRLFVTIIQNYIESVRVVCE